MDNAGVAMSGGRELIGTVLPVPVVDDVRRLTGMTFTADVLTHADLRFHVGVFNSTSTDSEQTFASMTNAGFFHANQMTTGTSSFHTTQASAQQDQIVSRMQRVPFRMVLRDVRPLDEVEGMPPGITDARAAIAALGNQYRDDPSMGVRMLVRQSDGRLGVARVEFDAGTYPKAQAGGIVAQHVPVAGHGYKAPNRNLPNATLELAADDPRIEFTAHETEALLGQRAVVRELDTDEPAAMREAQQLGHPSRWHRGELEDFVSAVRNAQAEGRDVDAKHIHAAHVARLRLETTLPTDADITAVEQKITAAKSRLMELERAFQAGKSSPPPVRLEMLRHTTVDRVDLPPKVERLDLTGHQAPAAVDKLPDTPAKVLGEELGSSSTQHYGSAWLEIDPSAPTDAVRWEATARPGATFATTDEHLHETRYAPPLDPSTPDTTVLYEVPDQSAVALIGPDGVVPLHMDGPQG
jgi:hypothetical protein